MLRVGWAPASVLVLGLAFPGPAWAHEPIFGLGPHVVFEGGVGVEMEVERESSGRGNDREAETRVVTEVIYGLTRNLSVTLVPPAYVDRKASELRASGFSRDMAIRLKYRFWRRDRPGLQDSAAVIGGVGFGVGDDRREPTLSRGTTDWMGGLAIARESRRWYWFASGLYARPGRDDAGLRRGAVIRLDGAWGLRPFLARYDQWDLVVLMEVNAESRGAATSMGERLSGTAADRLFLSPSFFLTYRNWAVKGGIQIPAWEDAPGDASDERPRFALALEVHL